MNAFGLDTPTTNPCRTRAASDAGAGEAGGLAEELLAPADRFDTEIDEVRRADELEHVEDHDRLLDDDAEPERDEHDDDDQPERVAGDAGQRDPAAVGERAADHEDDARPGDRDEDQRRDAEAEQLVDGDHASR